METQYQINRKRIVQLEEFVEKLDKKLTDLIKTLHELASDMIGSL